MAIDKLIWTRQAAIKVKGNGVAAFSNSRVMLGLHSFPVECVDAGSSSAQNGGGDLRFSTDAYGRYEIPCSVVEFVTNATEANRKAQVWIELPSWPQSTDQIIWVWYSAGGGKTQPPIHSDYGQQKTWAFPRAVYSMEEASGQAIDLTKQSINLDRNGPTQSTTAKVGSYSQLFARASSQYFLGASNVGISGAAARSIACWVRLNDTNRAGILGWGANGIGLEFYLSIRNNHWYVWPYGSGYDWDTGVTPATATWYHLILTYDGATQLELYVNGVRQGTGFTIPAALNTTAGPINVGREVDGGTTSYLDGNVDHVRVYDSALSQSQVTATYNTENAPTTLTYKMRAAGVSYTELSQGGWQKNAQITVKPNGTSTNLTGAIVVLDRLCLPDEMMGTGINAALQGGGDIRFSLDRHGLVPIPCEVRYFERSTTPANRRVEIWIKMPQWRFDIDTEIWVWWKHASITSQPSPYFDSGIYRVWPEYFSVVFHLHDGANPIDNNSMYLVDGTGSGNIPNSVTGQIDKAQGFNGTTGSIVCPHHDALNLGAVDFSLSCWFNCTAFATTRQIFAKRVVGSGNYEIQITSSGKLRVYMEQAGDGYYFESVQTITAGTTYKIDIIRNGSTITLYVNGVLDTSVTRTTDTSSTGSLYIGSDGGTSEFFYGWIDEVEITKGVAFAADYVKASYNNELSPTTYFVAGAVLSVDLFHGYTRSQVMEIDQTYVDADITDFPVLLTQANLPSEMFAATTKCRDDGGDIAIGSIDGLTRYACEIAYINVASSIAEIWVRVPAISGTVNTQFKVYWRKPGQKSASINSMFGRKKVWDRHYLLVHHLNQANLNGSTFEDYFRGEELDPFFTAPPGAGGVFEDFGNPKNGYISGPGQGDDTKLFNACYSGSGNWTLEVSCFISALNSAEIRMVGASTTIELGTTGANTNVTASCTGKTDITIATPFTGNTRGWYKIVYDATAQTLTYYYSTNSGIGPANNPTPWVQVGQHTTVNLAGQTFYPEFDNPDSATWYYFKMNAAQGSPKWLPDSTRFARHFPCYGNLPVQEDAIAYKGQHLDGSTDYGRIEQSNTKYGAVPINGCDITLETWTKRDSTAAGYILSQGVSGTTRDRLHFGWRDTNKFTLAFWGDDLNSSGDYPGVVNWTYWAGVFTLSSLEQRLFADGISETSRTAGGSLNSYGPFDFGRKADAGGYFDGKLDEVRVSRAIRSAAYIKANFYTIKTPNTFCFKSGTVAIRRIVGKLLRQGTRLVNIGYANLIHTGAGTNVTQWRNNGTELGTFDPFSAVYGTKQNHRGWDAVQFAGNAALKSSFATPASLLGDPDFTIEAWIYAPAPTVENVAVQTGSRGAGGDANCSLNAGFHPSWGAGSFMSDDIGYSPSDILSVENFDWHHVVMVRRTSIDKTFIYIDGVCNNTKDHTINIQSNGNIHIGGAKNGAGTGLDNPLTGMLKNVRIYNGALTEADIIQNFHLGFDVQAMVKGPIEGGLVNTILINGGMA